MNPVWFYLFGYPLHLYAVMIALGFVVGIWVAVRYADRVGISRDMILDLSWWLLIGGLVGSRVAFIIVNWGQYWYACTDIAQYNALYPKELPLTEPDCTRLLRFWNGGLVFYGGVIGGVLVLIWFMRREKQPLLPVADALIPSLAIGQFFGRLGCLFAGCCWGKPSAVPWAIHFPKGSMAFRDHVEQGLLDPHAAHDLGLHPTQLYDAGYGLFLFVALLILRSRKRFHGEPLLWWMVLYPLGRSTVELFRGDAERGFVVEVVSEPINRFLGVAPDSVTFLSTSQFISLCVMLTAAGLLVYLRRRAVGQAF